MDRHPACGVNLNPLPVSDPKDYSAVMGALARQVRSILADLPYADLFVCVSSGTAEMRVAWFLLRAANVIRARLLQVGSPAEPLFGAAGVKEVSLEGSDWGVLRDFVMPIDDFSFRARLDHCAVDADLDERQTGLIIVGTGVSRASRLSAEPNRTGSRIPLATRWGTERTQLPHSFTQDAAHGPEGGGDCGVR
jgi:hypothetical protein